MKANSYAEQRSAASQPTVETALSLLGLRKSYGEVEAVRGIDLEVERGEIFAFLGPNGAGKTTTVEILEGFRPRSSGEVSVLGVDPADGTREWRDRIGIVLQESAPDPGLTVREALELYAGYYSRPDPSSRRSRSSDWKGSTTDRRRVSREASAADSTSRSH